MLLHEILQNGRGEDIAVIDRGRRITYDELREALRPLLRRRNPCARSRRALFP